MTAADIWLYLCASFLVGLGLGWWLFSGRAPVDQPATSAEAARKRARPSPASVVPPREEPSATASEPSASAMQAIPSEVLVSLRQQLEQARDARKEAESLASQLDEQRRAALARESDARDRQDTLAARLHKARGDRDHLRAEVEAARRTITRLEDDSSGDLPTAHLGAEDTPDPPNRLRTARASAPEPARPPPAPERIVPRSSGATARVATTLPTPRRTSRAPKSRGPVEVLFGALSSVPVTPNTRSIPFELTARMKPDASAEAQVEDLHVFVRFDLEDEGVAINGRRRGPLTLYRGSALTRDHPIVVQLGVSTGFHSDAPEASRPAAVAGNHRIVIKLEYLLSGSQDRISARFAAAIPVITRPD